MIMQASIGTSGSRSKSVQFTRHLCVPSRALCNVTASRRTAQTCAVPLGQSVSPTSLRIQRLVGQGSFGEVFEVRMSTLKAGGAVYMCEHAFAWTQSSPCDNCARISMPEFTLCREGNMPG